MERAGADVSSGDEDRGRRVVFLGTAEDWFASALRSMLEPEGFVVVRATSSDETLSRVRDPVPDLVILDDRLPPLEAPELMRQLREGPLPRHVPVLYHDSHGGPGSQSAEVLEAGAWALITEPIGSAALVAQLERLLRIGRSVAEASRQESFVDPETEMSTAAGLSWILPPVADLARRQATPLCFVAIGPTDPGDGATVERRRRIMAELCRRHVRRSDFVGWLDGGSDFAVVAFGTSRTGAEEMVHRLREASEERSNGEGTDYALSAGILEVEPAPTAATGRDGSQESSSATKTRLDSLHALAASRAALGEARDAGGDIRFVDVV